MFVILRKKVKLTTTPVIKSFKSILEKGENIFLTVTSKVTATATNYECM